MENNRGLETLGGEKPLFLQTLLRNLFELYELGVLVN